MKQASAKVKNAKARSRFSCALLRVLGGLGRASRRSACALLQALALACAAFAISVDVPTVMQEFDRMAALPLWPNFQPARIPIAIYDGTQTWLVRHPAPPAQFQAAPGHPGLLAAPGRSADVVANTSSDIGGALTATALLDRSTASPRKQAALLMHEAFHVYQRQQHPDWSANEAVLFLYPVDKPDLLFLRRLESEALRRALEARPPQSECWTRTALDLRLQRFAQLGPEFVEYERRSELNEGLAQYVEDRAFGAVRDELLPAAEFPADGIRQRVYASGEALALLLDRFTAPPGGMGATWRDQLNTGKFRFLDQALARRLAGAKACEFFPPEERQAKQRAAADVQKLQSDRERMLQDFQARPGWRVVLEASQPLLAQGFDPLNVAVLARGLVLHKRFMKAGGKGVSLEVMNEPALTEAAGEHPLFSGYRRVTLDGFATEPTVTEKEHAVTLAAAGVKGSFASAKVERDERARQITISF